MKTLASFRPCLAPTALLLLLAFAGRATGGPPLVTDDPETPGLHGWEVNVSDDVEKTRERLAMDAPFLDINYGRTENDQLRIQFPLARFIDPEEGDPHAGVGDLAMGWKYRFLDEEKFGFAASVYPQMILPTGNRHVDVGDGRTELFLPMEIGKHFCDERLFVYAEGGYYQSFNGAADDAWDYGLAAEWKWTKKLTVMGEVGGRMFPNGGEPDDPFFNLGGAYHCNDTVAIIGSAGRSFRDRSSGAPEFNSFLGFQFTWGAEKKDEEKDDAEKNNEKGSENSKGAE